MSLRIATFTLKDFFLPKGDAERALVEAKVANVAANVLRAKPDVVALQEVGEEEHLVRLATKELASLGYGAPILGTQDKRGIRCAILSRLPVLWSQVHTQKTLSFPRFFEGDPEPFPNRIPLRRGVVHVRIDAPGLGEIDVLTAHFKSNLGVSLRTASGEEIEDHTARGRGEAAMRSLVARAAEALFVRGLVDDIIKASPDHHVCVLGDLNDRAESLPVRLLKGMGELSSGMLKSCADLMPAEQRFSCFHANEKSMIDHVLLSERLYRHVKTYEIYNEKLRYHGPHIEPTPLTEDSDHALCVVELAE